MDVILWSVALERVRSTALWHMRLKRGADRSIDAGLARRRLNYRHPPSRRGSSDDGRSVMAIRATISHQHRSIDRGLTYLEVLEKAPDEEDDFTLAAPRRALPVSHATLEQSARNT